MIRLNILRKISTTLDKYTYLISIIIIIVFIICLEIDMFLFVNYNYQRLSKPVTITKIDEHILPKTSPVKK